MFDLDHLARQTAGDSNLQHELLTLFLFQLQDLETRMRAATGKPPGPELASFMHRLRGAATAVGALDLASGLGQAETAIESGSASEVSLASLRADIAAACDKLESLIATYDRASLAKAGESR